MAADRRRRASGPRAARAAIDEMLAMGGHDEFAGGVSRSPHVSLRVGARGFFYSRLIDLVAGPLPKSTWSQQTGLRIEGLSTIPLNRLPLESLRERPAWILRLRRVQIRAAGAVVVALFRDPKTVAV